MLKQLRHELAVGAAIQWMAVCWLGLAGAAWGQPAEQQAWASVIKAKETGLALNLLSPKVENYVRAYPESVHVPEAWYLLGDAFLEGDEPGKAGECFQKLYPQHKQLGYGDSILFRLGEVCFNQGNFPGAEKLWAELMQEYPGSHLLAEIELNQCRRALGQAKYAEAKIRLQSLVSRHPHYRGHSAVAVGWGRIAWSQQLYVGALEQLGDINTLEAVSLKAECWLALQRYLEMLPVFQAPAPPGIKAGAWAMMKMDLIWSLLEHEQYALVLEAADKLGDSNGADPGVQADLLLIKGNSYFSLRQYNEAQKEYQAWLKHAGSADSTYVCLLSGLAFCKNHQFDLAEKAWRTIALEGMPENKASRVLLLAGQALMAEQAWVQAKPYFEQLVTRYAAAPEAAQSYLRLAQIQYQLGNDRQAMASYVQFVQHSPKNRGTTGTQAKLELSGSDTLEAASDKLVHFYAHDQDAPAVDQMLQASALSRRQLPWSHLETRTSVQTRSFSYQAAMPWLHLIAWPPVLEVHPQQPAWPVQHWSFSVRQPKGETFFLQSGDAFLPETIAWDGRKKNGGRLEVGEPFEYVLTLDRNGGQPLSLASENKQFSALGFREQDRLQIALLSSALFTGEYVSEFGASLLREAASALAATAAGKLSIQVTALDRKQGEARGKALRLFLRQRLEWPEEELDVNVETAAGAGQEKITLLAVKQP